jgi:hypothetical protein
MNKPVDIHTVDKSYKEAVTSDAAIKSAIDATRHAAQMTAAFYHELIEGGLPEEFAKERALTFSDMLIDKVRGSDV